MSVGVLLVTHAGTGEAVADAARTTLGGELPLKTKTYPVGPDCEPEAATREIRRLCAELDDGDGVLILNDLYGSTPCNVSANCREDGAVHVVSGVNLAMLIKIMNYHSLDLRALTEKALEGGRGGVMEARE